MTYYGLCHALQCCKLLLFCLAGIFIALQCFLFIDVNNRSSYPQLAQVYIGIIDSINAELKRKNIQFKSLGAISCPELVVSARENTAGFTDPNIVNGSKESYTFQAVYRPTFWVSLHRPAADPVRASMLHYKKYYEQFITAEFQDILKHASSGRVIDVGMNIGWFTLLSRSLGHEVLSFEPNPMNILRTCESIALNKWTTNITIFPYALSDTEATMNFFLNSRNPGKSRLVTGNQSQAGSFLIPVKRIDDIVTTMGWLNDPSTPIYILKIDVEGFEPNVLAGAHKLVNSGILKNILMEFTPRLSDSKMLASMVTQLLDANFKLVSATIGGGNEKISMIRSDNSTVLLADLISVSRSQSNLRWERKK
jgi:FkbM family methyltransferase